MIYDIYDMSQNVNIAVSIFVWHDEYVSNYQIISYYYASVSIFVLNMFSIVFALICCIIM